jgi:uncharacterized protein (DUF1800 family)
MKSSQTIYRTAIPLMLAALLSACGNSSEEMESTPTEPSSGQAPDGSTLPPASSPSASPSPGSANAPANDVAMGVADARRLLKQATFGPNESLVTSTAAKSVNTFLNEQFATAASTFTRGGSDAVHKWTDPNKDYCEQFAAGTAEGERCWTWNYSSQPITGDFFTHAVTGNDQLRQRVAFALSQILVVSDTQVEGTYGLREYQQILRNKAFDNYRDVLKEVTLSPSMGIYLSNVNNDKAAPNENYARELLQLFSIGVCELNADGTLKGGACQATYNNEDVRAYAYAMTGWTYPKGGANPWCNKDGAAGTKCWDDTNPTYLKGRMVPMASRHDTQERKLLAGVAVPASRTPEQALEKVLDSVMAHPNIAPFISKQLIQHLVTSNPSSAYIGRVAAAFNSGSSNGFGSGTKGDLKATIAAVLLDTEARDANVAAQANFGKLQEPALYIANVLRAMNGATDGYPFSAEWMFSGSMGQAPFQAPSVFNFYPPDYPMPGKAEFVGPQFAIENVRSTFERLNFVNLIGMFPEWGDYIFKARPAEEWSNSKDTKLNLSGFETDAADPPKLVNRLADLLTEGRMPQADRDKIVTAMNTWTSAEDEWLAKEQTPTNHRVKRVKTAVYLMLSSQYFMVQQ